MDTQYFLMEYLNPSLTLGYAPAWGGVHYARTPEFSTDSLNSGFSLWKIFGYIRERLYCQARFMLGSNSAEFIFK